MGRSEAPQVGQVFKPRGFCSISEKFGRFYCRFVASRPSPIILTDVGSSKSGRIDMNLRTLVKLFALPGAAMALGATPGFAAGGIHCQDIGGGVLTNFLDPSQCLPTSGSPNALCTDGTATGDLRGAVGVQVLGISGNVYHVRHHWVTESGDTISLSDAFLTAFPTSDPNRVLADYLHGVEIKGGTGRFDGATGNISSVFGAADLQLGQITLRYAGTVCFPTVKE
jgi:hypothetical protein